MQSKPSCGDSKTTVITYAAVIRYTTVVKIEALTSCSLPVFLDWSEIVLSPVSIDASYVGVHPPRVHYRYDDSTLSTTTYVQANYPSTILGIQYDDSAVIIHAILQTPLTILTALMPLNKSADTL